MPAQQNALDKLIGYISPRTALRRHAARELMSRAFEGASTKDGWFPRRAGASADADFIADGTMLRNRARSLVANVPEAKRSKKIWGAYVIGTGITTQFKHPRQAVADRLNAAYAVFVKEADADNRLNLFGLQRNAENTQRTDGELLIRIRSRRPTDGLHVPIQLQALEIDWLDTTRTTVERDTGNVTVCGIEYNAIGLPVFYWLYEYHPGDPVYMKANSIRSRRIPAESIIHYYDPERPGQGRGITAYHAVIATVRDLNLYQDAERARKNLEARLSVLATGDVSDLALDAGDGTAKANAQATGELGTLGSGNILQVPGATALTVVEPKPNTGHNDYVKSEKHSIAAGLDITYESMSGDLRETNFSSARVGRLDFKAIVEQHRWLITIPRLIEPIDAAFVNACVLAGHITAKDALAVTTEHSAPRWEYVNPIDDVNADLKEIAGGLTTWSQKIRDRGSEPATVFKEAADDVKRFKSAEMLDVLLALQNLRALAGAAPATPPTDNTK